MDEWKDNQRDGKMNEVERVIETKVTGENIHYPSGC